MDMMMILKLNTCNFWNGKYEISRHITYYTYMKDTGKPMGRPRSAPVFEIEYQGEKHQAIERLAKPQGKTSGGVYVPVTWIGDRVICINLDKP
jgi:hypothetical protein